MLSSISQTSCQNYNVWSYYWTPLDIHSCLQTKIYPNLMSQYHPLFPFLTKLHIEPMLNLVLPSKVNPELWTNFAVRHYRWMCWGIKGARMNWNLGSYRGSSVHLRNFTAFLIARLGWLTIMAGVIQVYRNGNDKGGEARKTTRYWSQFDSTFFFWVFSASSNYLFLFPLKFYPSIIVNSSHCLTKPHSDFKSLENDYKTLEGKDQPIPIHSVPLQMRWLLYYFSFSLSLDPNHSYLHYFILSSSFGSFSYRCK